MKVLLIQSFMICGCVLVCSMNGSFLVVTLWSRNGERTTGCRIACGESFGSVTDEYFGIRDMSHLK